MDCWEEDDLWTKLDDLCYSVENHSDLFLKILRNFSSIEVERVMAIVWGIWRYRNSVVWDGKFFTPTRVVHEANIFLTE